MPSPSVTALRDAIQKAASSRAWSQGVQLAREDRVTGTGTRVGADGVEDEIVCEVRIPSRPVAVACVLYPRDLEWECECPTKEAACSHVAAAAIALTQARDAGDALPKSKRAGGAIRHLLEPEAGGLSMRRVVVHADGTEEPLTVPLSSLVSGRVDGPAVAPTQADLIVDTLLGTRGGMITADRLDQVDFSVPYEEAGLQIMVRAGGESFSTAWATFRTALSPAVLRIIAIFLGMIFLVANVTWFVDRKMNEDFPRPYWRGIWEAIWWSTVTVTTVGYGDKTPKSPAGRFVGILWMLLGLFLVANFTAGMTAALSVRALQSQISGLGDLDDMRVATVAGTSADTFMADNRLSPALRTPTIEEAFDALLANDVDAVLFDGPILLAFANTDGAGRVKVLAYRFDTEFYAFALPHDSPHRAGINQALLAMMEDGTYEQIRQRWLGPR